MSGRGRLVGAGGGGLQAHEEEAMGGCKRRRRGMCAGMSGGIDRTQTAAAFVRCGRAATAGGQAAMNERGQATAAMYRGGTRDNGAAEEGVWNILISSKKNELTSLCNTLTMNKCITRFRDLLEVINNFQITVVHYLYL